MNALLLRLSSAWAFSNVSEHVIITTEITSHKYVYNTNMYLVDLLITLDENNNFYTQVKCILFLLYIFLVIGNIQFRTALLQFSRYGM